MDSNDWFRPDHAIVRNSVVAGTKEIDNLKQRFAEIVVESAPKHATRDYKATDEMRDIILNKIRDL